MPKESPEEDLRPKNQVRCRIEYLIDFISSAKIPYDEPNNRTSAAGEAARDAPNIGLKTELIRTSLSTASVSAISSSPPLLNPSMVSSLFCGYKGFGPITSGLSASSAPHL